MFTCHPNNVYGVRVMSAMLLVMISSRHWDEENDKGHLSTFYRMTKQPTGVCEIVQSY